MDKERRAVLAVMRVSGAGKKKLAPLYRGIEAVEAPRLRAELAGGYGVIDVEVGDGVTSYEFVSRLNALTARTDIDAVDVILSTHGRPGSVVFTREDCPVATDLATQVANPKLRLLYDTCCFGNSHSEAFLVAGFDAVVGAKGENTNGWSEFHRLVRSWIAGERLSEAVAGADRVIPRMFWDLMARTFGGMRNVDSEKVVAGNAALDYQHLTRRPASVDHERVAGHETAGTTGEQEERAVQLVLAAHPGHRRVLLDEADRAWVGVHPCRHLGEEPARAQRVDADALARPLKRELAGEVDHRALAGGVVRLLHRRRPDEAEHRGHVDDAAATRLHHVCASELAEVPDRRDVHLHRRAERVERLLLDPDHRADPGVVHEDVDPATLLDGRGHEPLPFVGRRQVRPHGNGSGQLGRQRLQTVLAPGGEHDTCTGRMEHPRRSGRRGPMTLPSRGRPGRPDGRGTQFRAPDSSTATLRRPN